MDYSQSEYKESENRLFESLTQNVSIHGIMNLASEATGNPVYFLDPNLRLVSFSSNLNVKSPIWSKLTEKEYVDNPSIIDSIKKYDVNQSGNVIRFAMPNSKHSIMQSFIIINNKLVGFLGLCDLLVPFTEDDVKYMAYLQKILQICLCKNQFYQNIKSPDYEHFLLDLIKGHIADSGTIKLRQKLLDVNFEGFLTVLVINISELPAKIIFPSLIQNELNRLIDGSYSLIFDKCIVFLIKTKEANSLSAPVFQRIDEYLKSRKLIGSISNCFTGVEHLKTYYFQAYETNKIAGFRNDEPGLYFFRDNMVSFLLAVGVSHVNPINFKHPALEILEKYDSENNTNYLSSLNTYMICLGNMSESSKKLNIHYNTMKYRIKIIQDIALIDLKNPDTFISLLLSFRINKGIYGML